MKATKLGLIYQNKGWAQCPVVDDLGNGRLRIYFADRDEEGQAFITYIEVNSNDPRQVFYEHKAPVVALGDTGHFDEHGMIPSCIKTINGNKYLYYTGWRNQRSSVPYENAIGVIKIMGSFHLKVWRGPVIGKSLVDPIFTGSLFVDDHYESDLGKCVKGYYLSCFKWKDHEPYYNIRSAVSTNGIKWDLWTSGVVEIDLNEGEGGICSCAPYSNDIMIFCVRGDMNYREFKNKTYSIEYAKWIDKKWVRQGQLPGLEKSEQGWDSLMVCYPYILPNSNLLFYNGNHFGRSGIGYATIQK